MFPYYLLPNLGDAQEPEEEQAEESQSWLPSYIYAYVHPKPTPPPPPDPVIEEYNRRQEARIGYKADKKVTVVQPAGSGGGSEPTAAPKRPSYLDDVEAYGQRAEQRAAAQNAEQDSGDTPSEFAGEREITEADVLKFCEYVCEKDEAVFTQVMKIVEGFDPDADEQTIRQRVDEYLRLLGLNDYFPPDALYSTAFPPPELNHPTQEFLSKTFPDSWNPEWTTRAEMEAFLKERLVTFIPGFDLSIVPWDMLTVQGLVHYYGSLIDKAIKDNQQTMDFNTNVWLTELETELGLASQLLSRTAKAPLEDETALLEAFGYKDAAQARDRITAELSFVFETYGLQLPTDLAQWSLLELANAYHSVLTTVVQPSMHSEEGSEDYERALAFIDGYEHQVPLSSGYVPEGSEQYVIDRLEGRQDDEGWGPAADLFLFVASIFIEPVDWLVTGVEMADAARRGDWGSFLVNGVLAALPFVSGKVDNVAGKVFGASDDVVQAGFRNVPQNQISNLSELNLRRGFQRLGSDYVMEVDNYVDRTVSNYNSRNAGLLKTQMKRAAEADDNFAWRLKTHSEQDMHHIVPTGRWQGDAARNILSEKGVYVNSAYNGIALEKRVHKLTYSTKYTEAISKVIVRLENAPPEDIAMFLEKTAERLHKLNKHEGDLLSLKARYQTEIMDWFASYLD